MTQTNFPNSTQQVVSKQNLFTSPWIIYLQGIFKAIRAKFQLNLSGILYINTIAKSNSGASPTDLITYSLPANTLQNNGDILNIEVWGSFANNNNNKILTLNFGSQILLDTSSIAANGGSWEINATIVRISPISQEIIANIISSNSLITSSTNRIVGTQDLTTPLIIKCISQGSASNDLTQNALIIGLTPYD